MKLRVLFLGVLVMLAAAPKLARADEASDFGDRKVSAERLETFSRRFAGKDFQRFTFTQTKKISVLSRPLVTEGEMVFAKSKGLVWKTFRPAPSTLILTASGVFKTNGSGLPVKVDAGQASGAESFSKVFLSLFGGDMSSLENVFHLRLDDLDINHWSLELMPRSRQVAKYLKNIILRGGTLVEELEINEMNGDQAQIVFRPATGDLVGLREDERAYFQN